MLRIAFGGHKSGVRHTNHQVCLHRIRFCQCLSGLNSGMVDIHTVNGTVRAGKIDVFKYTSGLLVGRNCHTHIRSYPIFCKTYNLTRQHIPYKLSTRCGYCTALRRKNISVILHSDTQGLYSKGVSYANQLAGTAYNKSIGSFDLFHGIFYSIFNC